MWIHRVLPTYMIKWISTFEKNEEYLSNIKALNGFLDVSSGGGILATIALRCLHVFFGFQINQYINLYNGTSVLPSNIFQGKAAEVCFLL